MAQAEDVGRVRRVRRSVAEKRRIVGLTLEPGASVAQVARAQGVNANQVFAWRRAFERGELSEPSGSSTTLLPVTVSSGCEVSGRNSGVYEAAATSACIHIELPGRAVISVERGADALLLRAILESLRP